MNLLAPARSNGLVANILAEASSLGLRFISWIYLAASMKFLLYFFRFSGVMVDPKEDVYSVSILELLIDFLSCLERTPTISPSSYN